MKILDKLFDNYLDKRFAIHCNRWENQEIMNGKRGKEIAKLFESKVKEYINDKIQSIGEKEITYKLALTWNEEVQNHIKKHSDNITKDILENKFDEYVDTSINKMFKVDKFKDNIVKDISKNIAEHLAQDYKFLSNITQSLRSLQTR